MISKYEVGALVNAEFKEELRPYKICLNIDLSLDLYRSINDLTQIAVHASKDHNLPLLNRCFGFVEKLYNQGEHLVKQVIENIFIYTIFDRMPQDKTERLIYQSFIPNTFRTIYLQQVMTV